MLALSYNLVFSQQNSYKMVKLGYEKFEKVKRQAFVLTFFLSLSGGTRLPKILAGMSSGGPSQPMDLLLVLESMSLL